MSFFASATIAQSPVSLKKSGYCFRVFNVAPIILVNVLDPNKAVHTTVNAAEDCPVVDGQAIHTKPYTLLETLEIKNGEEPLAAGGR